MMNASTRITYRVHSVFPPGETAAAVVRDGHIIGLSITEAARNGNDHYYETTLGLVAESLAEAHSQLGAKVTVERRTITDTGWTQ